MSRGGDIGWKSLRKLSIDDAKLSDGLVEKILLGCPALEMLELYLYDGFSRLSIDDAGLKKLVLREFVGPADHLVDEVCRVGLVISAPYLQTLEISGRAPRDCWLLDLWCLVDAKLACQLIGVGHDCWDIERIQTVFRGLLSS